MFSQPDRRAYQLELLLQSMWPESRGGVEPAADPFSTGALHRHDLGKPSRILYGRIIEGVAYTHFYRVQVENAMSTVPCVAMGHTSFSAFGARQLNTYSPGTAVYIVVSPDSWFGTIIGAEPDYLIDPTHACSDFVVQGSRVGVQADNLHKAPFNLAEGGTVVDWSAGRPADSLPAGEWGAISELGLRFFLDSFMAMMAVDESTGVWGFYLDQLLRVAGHNLQQRAFGTDKEWLDDETEHHVAERQALYPWEAMGNIRRDQGGWHLEWSASQTQQEFPWLSRFEPWFDDQLGFHRLETYQGYLGGVMKRMLKTLPLETFVEPLRMRDKIIAPGVFEETLLPTGQYQVRSAKSIILAKELRLPNPKQLKRPEDLNGDNGANYRRNGVLGGTGDLHKVRDGLTPNEDDTDEPLPLLRASALLDTLAYAFNWEGPVPFHYHTRDWYLPDESDMVEGPPEGDEAFPGTPPVSRPDLSDAEPPFSSLANQQYLDPSSIELEVDERYDRVTYYRNGSSVALHDDGTISLTAAFGEQILLCGGSIFIDAPGDVWVRSGRNTNLWAGYDLIAKGHNSVDIHASNTDLRLSANRNMQALAGLSGLGGVLLESKAECAYNTFKDEDDEDVFGEDVISSGVVLRADKSQVVAISREVVLTNVGEGLENPGNLVLDFGQQKIVTRSSMFERHTEAAIDFIGSAVNEWWESGAIIDSELSINGAVRVLDCYLAVNGWIYATEHIATAKSGDYNYTVAKPDDDTSTTLATDFETVLTRCGTLDEYRTEAEGDLEMREGLEDARFSFRTPEQYKTDEGQCVLYEARWQQLGRLYGQTLPRWNEPTLEIGDTSLQPFPGFETWEEEDNLRQIDLGLYDTDEGYRVDRGTDYSDDTLFRAVNRVTLKDNYRIVRSPA